MKNLQRALFGGLRCLIGAMVFPILGTLESLTALWISEHRQSFFRTNSILTPMLDGIRLGAFSLGAAFYFPWRDELRDYLDSNRDVDPPPIFRFSWRTRHKLFLV